MNLSLLHQSCLNGDLDQLKEHLNDQNLNLIEDICEEKVIDNEWTFIQINKSTPIICAIQNNHFNILQFLCQNRANIYLLEPIRKALQLKRIEIVDYLLKLLIVKDVEIVPKRKGPSSSLTLWYQNVGETWLDYLPIGNGSLGAMISGGYPTETIQLNIDTLWAGSPHDYSNQGAFNYLSQIRQLIDNERWIDAQNMLNENFFGKPVGQCSYQPVANLFIDFFENNSSNNLSNYQRELNLQNALFKTTYQTDNQISYERTSFSSYPDQSIIYHIQSTSSNGINCVVRVTSEQKNEITIDELNKTLIVDGIGGDHQSIKGMIQFRLLINVESDGECYPLSDHFIVYKSTFVTLRVVISTNYINYQNINGDQVKLSDNLLKNSLLYSYEDLFNRHLNDYQSLFNRVQLNLGETEQMNQPTDQRIKIYSDDPSRDPQLLTLYFQFGRYLLISSSRPGSQAANLQGIWNDSMTPPWDSKYTININIEMNYWPAGPTNLIECYQPLFNLIKDISQTGQSTAQIHYGTKREGSWVCHHNTDIWRGTAPVDDAVYGTWPTGGIWLCKSIWDHYLFTNDQTNLLRSYPILRSASQFFLETLVKYSNSYLTNPSMSPEVPHHVQTNAVVCHGPTLDILLIKDLFNSLIQSSILFNIDQDFRQEVQTMLNQLPPLQIGKLGQLQEWFEDWDEVADVHNRHLSHLYCVYPGNSVTNDPSPYRDAAIRSLDLRGILIPSTGWSLAWKANIWARLHQGPTSFKLLTMLLTPQHTSSNLFDLIDGPPFQIDANFGATAAIAEMILQSHNNSIQLLPALPKDNWPQGFVIGLRARGNYQVNIWWNDGKLDHAQIIPLSNSDLCTIKYKDKQIILKDLIEGFIYHIDHSLQLFDQTINQSQI